MHRIFILFTFILCNTLFTTSFTSSREAKDLVLLDYVINQNKDVKDSIQLKRNFDILRSKSNDYVSKNLNIIYQTLLANIYAEKLDKLNPKSEQLFNSARKTAKDLGLIDMQIWINTQFGYYYYSYNQYLKAYPYFMESSKLLDFADNNNVFQKSDVYKKNAFFFMNVKELDKSEKYLFLALQYANKKDNEYGSILNAIGHIFLEKKDTAKANHYFNQTKEHAVKNNDKIRYAKALGDIACIQIQNKEYELAIQNLITDIEISRESKNHRNLMYANIQLGKLYLQLDRIDEAKEILNEAKKYTSGKAYLNSFEKDIFTLLLDIAIKKGNTAEELDFRRKLSELETEIKLTDGENVINEINWNIQKNNFDYKYETEKIKREKTILLKNALIIISILLIIIVLFVFISFKRKMKIQNSINDNKVLKLHNEKLKSESRLNKANKTLDSYKIYLADKNTQIEILNKEIDNLSKSSNKKTEEHELQLNNLLKSHLMTDENWNNFKKVFASEKADFVSYLENNFSDLTESNLRIIYLTKLGLTNIEIAHLLGITPDSVKKAKQRLRKKYDNYELIFKGIQN